METTFANSARQSSPGRPTILLALGLHIEPLRAGVYDHAKGAGWSVLDLGDYHATASSRAFRPDGVIFQAWHGTTPLVRRLLRRGVPVVQLGGTTRLTCCVDGDQRAIGRAAAEHFGRRGFTNVAFLHSETFDQSPFRWVGLSFVERARELGARADLFAIQRPGRVVSWTRLGTLAKRFAKAISRLELPVGIFTYHDRMALRICQFCEAIGLQVPEQVAVLGYGNDPFKCDFARIPLSSVDPNFFGQGRAAAELLERLMDGEPAPEEPILVAPTGVVTRQSTDVLALADVDAARALRYMWDHLAEPLQVADIAEAVGLSRRKLERQFRTHLRRGVAEELIRKRLERACELLVQTQTPVKVIAEQVGFTSEKWFFVTFRKQMGTTPRKYRLAHIAGLREDGESERAGRE